MNNYLKNGNINIKIDVDQKDVLKTNLEFWSHDLKSGLLTIKYTNLGEPVPLVCDSTVRLIMRFTENGENKHRIETMTVTDKVSGIATLEIPDEILGYEGVVECGTYIDFKNGQTLDAGYFTFRMRKSMIDGDFKELDELYVHEFAEAVEKIKLIAEEYESKYATAIADDQEKFNDLINSWQEIGNVNELATKNEVRLVDEKIEQLNYVGTNLWAPDFYKDNIGFYNISGILDTSAEDYIYTDYITVNQIKTIWINVIDAMTSGAIYILEYDKDKNFIARRSQSTTAIGESFRVLGDTTAFIKLDAPNKFGGKIKVELGNKATDYSLSPLDLVTLAKLESAETELRKIATEEKDGMMSLGDKQLLEKLKKESEVIYAEITFKPGFEDWGTSARPKSLIINGKHAQLKGAIKNTKKISAGSTVDILQIPTIYASKTLSESKGPANGMNEVLTSVMPDGIVTMSKYGTTTDTEIPPGTYLSFDVKWIIG